MILKDNFSLITLDFNIKTMLVEILTKLMDLLPNHLLLKVLFILYLQVLWLKIPQKHGIVTLYTSSSP
jgi:hypothetical protein